MLCLQQRQLLLSKCTENEIMRHCEISKQTMAQKNKMFKLSTTSARFYVDSRPIKLVEFGDIVENMRTTGKFADEYAVSCSIPFYIRFMLKMILEVKSKYKN